MKTAHFALLVLLGTIVMGRLSPVFSQVQIPWPRSFVGYGGEIMLPLLDGANFSFYAGEQLWVAATAATTLWLVSPDGVSSYVADAGEQPRMLKAFTEEDSEGNWLLGQNTPAGMMSATICLQKHATLGAAELSFNMNGDNITASIEKNSQSIAAFVSEDGLQPICPEDIVRIQFENDYSGLASIKILDDELRIVEGRSGNVSQTVEVSPLIANFSVVALDGEAEFAIPSIHKVGLGGLFPLRYGAITVETTAAENNLHAMSSRFYVYPERIDTGAKTSSRLDLKIKDALSKTIELLVLDPRISFLGATTVSSIFFRLPLVNMYVYDQRHSKYLTTEDFSLRLDGAQVWYDDLSAYILYRQKAFISEENTDLTDSLTCELKIGGFNSTEAGPIAMYMEPGQSVLTVAGVYELKVAVKDLWGNPVKANLMMNNTVSVNFMGETKLLLPAGHYSLMVGSELGTETRTLNLKDTDLEIAFTFFRLDPLLTLLVVIGAAETLATAKLALSIRRQQK